MTLTVNREAVLTVLDEAQLHREIAAYLEEVMGTELAKEAPDCDLIDECVAVLEALQSNGEAAPMLRLRVTKPQLTAYCRRHSKRGAVQKGVIAAALALVISGTAAFYTVPAFAGSVRTLFERVVYSLTTAVADTEEDGEVVSIYATVPENGDVRNAAVTAVLRDGSEQAVPLNDCRITQTTEEADGERYVLTVIAYKGCACSLITEAEEGVTEP
ncbi:MAG: hypothetical protein IJ168_05900 [Eubacterium sp.]|nr:hypothetical protein [Eubacterium sp.]